MTERIELKYKPLEVDFAIPEFLQNVINEFVEYLNTHQNPLNKDLFESEIRADLNSCDRDFNEEQYWIHANYYCLGGIYRSRD